LNYKKQIINNNEPRKRIRENISHRTNLERQTAEGTAGGSVPVTLPA
jgi:hypothetical protein